jgi:hypothetical protein
MKLWLRDTFELPLHDQKFSVCCAIIATQLVGPILKKAQQSNNPNSNPLVDPKPLLCKTENHASN